MTETSDQIERESDAHRANVSGLIEELRTRLTAGEIVDEMLGSDTAHTFTRNFSTQVKNNPLALALIGGGVAWLMFSGPPSTSDGSGKTLSRKAHDMADKAKDLAKSAADKTSSAIDGASSSFDGDGITRAAENAKAYAQSAQSAVNEAAASMAEKGSALLRKTASGARLDRLAREQPLLLAGIGLAMGVLLGAGLPLSEIENELLGEESDHFRAQAAEAAREGVDKSKEAAQAAYDTAVETLTGDEDETPEITPVYKPDGINPAPRYPQ